MNIAFFLTLKKDIIYLYDDFSMRQALEKMRIHGYTAIPVLSHEGKYIGTVSEGDFLWYFFDKEKKKGAFNEKQLEKTPLKEIIKNDKYNSVKITASIEELVSMSLTQNFVPVVDDNDNFVGLVLRKDIIKHFSEKAK
ncbi:MAG: CBS domain-containing protein [Acutalibacteraceae bacterium]|nr:CBS domain-containing protein [Acutalibacteraceae bacterium]